MRAILLCVAGAAMATFVAVLVALPSARPYLRKAPDATGQA